MFLCVLWVFDRVSLDAKLQEPELVLKSRGSVSGLAVDWTHRLLYWSSTGVLPEDSSVNVALLDGSAQHTLITGLDKPSAVAVEPHRG